MSDNPKKINKNKQTIEEQYVKMSAHEHVLALPDTYIGSVEPDDQIMWVFNSHTNKLEKRNIVYIPGLYKIFDEILVNARDHSVRDKKCQNMYITINQELGEISVWNDGDGIPIEVHKEHKMHIPELIFGNLLTSSNYHEKQKIVGGKNGYGAKLANIYSTDFWIETVCAKNKKFYKQHFHQNMYKVDPAEIKTVKSNTSSYTKITFKPDLARFSCEKLSDDMVALMKKRAYDLAACTGTRIKVFLNDNLIEVKNFEDYIKMFYDNDDDNNNDDDDDDDIINKNDDEENDENISDVTYSKPIYETVNSRWNVAVVYDPAESYQQVSYVNGICTFQGGTHVTHVTTQIVNALSKHIKDKYKDVKVRDSQIRDNMTIFIECTIEDPAFNSQTKECLTNKVANFGSRCDVSEDFIKKIIKDTDIVKTVVSFAKLKELSEMKKSDGKKRGNLRGIAKLEDADWAGGHRRSSETRLILTEGDSAKTFAINGRSVIGTEKYGVFPLKGKMLNVRDASPKQLLKNEEIKFMKLILGLKQGKKYTSTKDLRYGGIVILVDQDVDGSHIKGLLLNFIHFFWPSLLKIPNFVQCMATPIVKAFKKTDSKKLHPKTFYTLTEYRNWINKDLAMDTSKWKIKYYKGLGTSTDDEAKEAFNDFEQSLVSYVWSLDNNNANNLIKNNSEDSDNSDDSDSDNDDNDDNDDNNNSDSDDDNGSSDNMVNTKIKDTCDKAINLAFAKLLAGPRKFWLKGYDKENIIENNIKKVTVHDFVHKELIHFSNYDNQRSIPSIDGFKPSHKKIIYGSHLRKLENNEVKVTQLSGWVSDKAEYHHGETSLQGTIVNMAQNYVGSNNLNILVPNGNFGTRRTGGKDASSARYIFTQFNPLVPLLFRKEDSMVLKRVVEDGKKVEPELYPTVIPMVLANGTEGIGTGFSTFVPCFNPKDIIANIHNLLDNKPTKPMVPWYHGFTGEIKTIDNKTFQSIGKYKILNENTVHVTELPIRLWTQSYKDYLESILTDDPKKPTKKKFIVDYKNHSGTNNVDFKITFAKGVMQKLIIAGTLEKTLKLKGSIKISNMHLYNEKGDITKYNTIDDILNNFYSYRLEMYHTRKAYYIKFLEKQMLIAFYRKKYIEDILAKPKRIIIERQKRSTIIEKLVELNYPQFSNIIDTNNANNEDDDENENDNDTDDKKSYDYLSKMALWSLTEEKIEELDQYYNDKKDELEQYKNLTVENMWKLELTELSTAYDKWSKSIDTNNIGSGKKSGKSGKSGKTTKSNKTISVTTNKNKNIKIVD